MKKIITSTIILLGLTGFINANTSTLNSSAQILTPIVFTSVDELSFGNLTTGAAGNTVFTLGTSDDITVTSGTGISDGEGIKTGKATISAQAGQTVTVSVDATGTLTNGTTTLNATYSTPQAGVNTVPAGAGGESMSAGGSFEVLIGGTLTVPANATSGVYAGTYNVIYSY